MARVSKHTISYEDGDGDIVDLCKIIFGGDGSYYVTAPYHPHNQALVGKITINYASEDMEFADLHEVAVLDDDERRLKLAHHPDGFLQLSGEGVVSGRDEDGAPKGLGVQSWPLVRPALGPSFALSFSDPVACGRPATSPDTSVVLRETAVSHMRPEGMTGLSIVGYYFPARWREFCHREADGHLWLPLIHPRAQAVKRLRVLLASIESDFPGLVGVEARPHDIDFPEGQPGFFLASATGDGRRNEDGDLIGVELVCMYPRSPNADLSLPTLNYPLDDPPYTTGG